MENYYCGNWGASSISLHLHRVASTHCFMSYQLVCPLLVAIENLVCTCQSSFWPLGTHMQEGWGSRVMKAGPHTSKPCECSCIHQSKHQRDLVIVMPRTLSEMLKHHHRIWRKLNILKQDWQQKYYLHKLLKKKSGRGSFLCCLCPRNTNA